MNIVEEVKLYFSELEITGETRVVGEWFEDSNNLLIKTLDKIKELEEDLKLEKLHVESRDLEIGRLEDNLYILQEQLTIAEEETLFWKSQYNNLLLEIYGD